MTCPRCQGWLYPDRLDSVLCCLRCGWVRYPPISPIEEIDEPQYYDAAGQHRRRPGARRFATRRT